MRAILHIGLFAFAFTVVGQARADDDHRHDDRRHERRTTIVVAPEIQHRTVRPVRAPARPLPREGEWKRGRHHRYRGMVEARQELLEQERDHDEIVRIVNGWTRAAHERNPHAQRNAERRAYVWIDREIKESNRKNQHGAYVHRLHALRRQLRISQGWHSQGRGRHRFSARKAEVLDELVRLSERQVYQARARARSQRHMAIAYR